MGSYSQGLPLPSAPFTFKVVGVTFVAGYPKNILGLAELCNGLDMEEGPAVVLRRDPDNPHDSNAIQVHVPQEGIGMIGHVPKEIAARLAGELDIGIHWRSHLYNVLIQNGHEDRPGITVKLQRVVDDG